MRVTDNENGKSRWLNKPSALAVDEDITQVSISYSIMPWHSQGACPQVIMLCNIALGMYLLSRIRILSLFLPLYFTF